MLRADERREKRKKERARAHQVRAGTERDDGSERESKKMRMEKKLASILFQNQRERNSQALFIVLCPLFLLRQFCDSPASARPEEDVLSALAGSNCRPRLSEAGEERPQSLSSFGRRRDQKSNVCLFSMMLSFAPPGGSGYYDEPLSPPGGLDLPVRSFTTEYEDECVSVR